MSEGVKLGIVGRFHSVARSGQENIAQGLPWVIPTTACALKGLTGTARIGSEPLNRIACALLAPSGLNIYIDLPRVNHGLCFLAPAGRMTDAK